MKIAAIALVFASLVGCAPTNEAAPPSAADAEHASRASAVAASRTSEPPASTTAEALGTAESIDTAAKTITIAHGPVDALKWPAMTMIFKADKVDIGSLKAGDRVAFAFNSTGMDGNLTSIKHE